jgi:predicted small secreted protein
MKKSLLLFVSLVLLLSTVLAGCPRPGRGPGLPHPPVPHPHRR